MASAGGRYRLKAAEPFLFLFSAVYFAHTSTVPQLLLQTVCHQKYAPNICNHLSLSNNTVYEEKTHQEAAEWTMFFILTVSAMSLVVCLIAIFSLQRTNFKVLLSVPGCTMLVQSVLYIFACTYRKYTIPLLYVGYCVPMLHADLQGALSLAYLYTTSITNQDSGRSVRMAYMESANSLGQALGVILSGFLIDYIGYRSVYVCTALISVFNITYGILLLDSLNETDENLDNEKTTKDFIYETLNTFKQMGAERTWKLIVSLLVLFFSLLAIMGELAIVVLFLKHTPLALDTMETQGFLCLLFIARGIGSILVGHIGGRYCSLSDFHLVLIGLLSMISFYFLLGSVTNRVLLYLSVFVSSAAPVALSTTRSICTKTLKAESAVLSLGLITLVGIFAFLIASFTASLVYAAVESVFPGIAIYTLGSICIVALLITVAQQLVKSDNASNGQDTQGERISLLANKKESVPSQ